MKSLYNQNQLWFRIIVLGVSIFSVLIVLIGGTDILFDFGWGFLPRDVIMASIVLVGTIIVNIIGIAVFRRIG